MFRSVVRDPLDVSAMQRFGLDYRVAEVIVRNNLIAGWDKLPDLIRRDKWEWHTDVGFRECLGSNSLLPTPPLNATDCGRIHKFRGTTLRKNASNLDADALYQSESVNMYVGEFLTVDHVDRIVTFYQSTSRDLTDHPFKVSTLEAVSII